MGTQRRDRRKPARRFVAARSTVMTDRAIARPPWPTRTTLWTSVALCVQILGSLWIMAGALYVVPLHLLVPLVPIAFTVFAYVGQRHKRTVGPTVFLALACACEA